MRIDAHQHFWHLKDRKGEWPPAELAAIYRDFTPDDLLPLLKEANMDGTILVQTMERAEDTAFMLALASEHDFIKGVVGWVDLSASDAREQIARLAANPMIKGLRPMLQSMPDDDWIAKPSLDQAIATMIALDLAFDALVMPWQLRGLLQRVERSPDLRVVIDHGAKPEIAQGRFINWQKDMARLAAYPHVHCKLSGLLTEAGAQKPEALRPYIETILELFGPDRVLWGSDWPVVRLAGDYMRWLSQCEEIVLREHHEHVFGGNAARFYRI
ncbi:amidohydrolase family protein [Rhizobium oryziradicis]|uniref:Amidohydrolase n=1 Tax=Rhizobium oryziradicis TaxID=1867956 RepID=A0A1Q8ZXZ5_9HYPH|nr:amidohydrolase family protein [Rhizobium oryziradicis]OLP46971.1 amidohydrolase [Rhizobium oryziradicis]